MYKLPSVPGKMPSLREGSCASLGPWGAAAAAAAAGLAEVRRGDPVSNVHCKSPVCSSKATR